jgi:hypothetical protein
MSPRRFVVLVVVAALCAALTPADAAAQCVICTRCYEDWCCDPTDSGGKRCMFSTGGSCSNIGLCPEEGPGSEPPSLEPKQHAKMYFFDVGGAPDFSGYPAMLTIVEAHDALSIQGQIALESGVATQDVLLRGGLYSVGGGPSDDPGPLGVMVSETGFVHRLDSFGESNLQVRVCEFESGGSPLLLADELLPASGGTLLVQSQVEGGDVVVALVVESLSQSEWEASYADEQAAFRADVQANLTQPAFAFSFGSANAGCQ